MDKKTLMNQVIKEIGKEKSIFTIFESNIKPKEFIQMIDRIYEGMQVSILNKVEYVKVTSTDISEFHQNFSNIQIIGLNDVSFDSPKKEFDIKMESRKKVIFPEKLKDVNPWNTIVIDYNNSIISKKNIARNDEDAQKREVMLDVECQNTLIVVFSIDRFTDEKDKFKYNFIANFEFYYNK